MGYLSFPPIIRTYLLENHGQVFQNEDLARTAAALSGALMSCVASHPFDTVKTCMQGDVERRTFRGMAQTFVVLAREGGVARFYNGLPWRYGRQFLGIFILDKVRSDLTPFVFPSS
eukprot:TRINITY_DN11583_c0_g1_i1.p2 TRINITY_DN11583_c0_g1~~TRINITY_DN11583_c0_g1_i1.p2  ORF type:complete len:116 (-),score=11.34 TRINITY_DN11583_c0_g1_i1:151-498(-)